MYFASPARNYQSAHVMGQSMQFTVGFEKSPVRFSSLSSNFSSSLARLLKVQGSQRSCWNSSLFFQRCYSSSYSGLTLVIKKFPLSIKKPNFKRSCFFPLFLFFLFFSFFIMSLGCVSTAGRAFKLCS